VKRTIMISSLIALVVIVAFSVFLGTRQPIDDAALTPSPLFGKTAPSIVGKELGGASFSLRRDLGHVVVVNFWASWCGPCKAEAPNLSTLAFQERHNNVDVVGVVFDDPVASAKAFQTYYGSLYPSVIDPGGAIANNYGVTSPPTTFIINAQGKVAAELLGAARVSQLVSAIKKVQG
jgi:thiol-disulfide isomerase/thioredoxin